MSEWFIGEYLVVKGIITRAQLEETLKLQREEGGFLGEILVKLGYTTEEKLLTSLSRQLRIPFVDLKSFMFNLDVLKMIPEDMVLRYRIIPLSKIKGILTVAMNDPLNLPVVNKIRDITNCEIETVFATRSDIRYVLDKFYDTSQMKKTAKLPQPASVGGRYEDSRPKEVKSAVDTDIKAMMNLLDSIIRDITRLRNYLMRVIKS